MKKWPDPLRLYAAAVVLAASLAGPAVAAPPRDWGAELRAADARLALAPDDEKALDARANALYFLQRYEDAAAAYGQLVRLLERRHGPGDASLVEPLGNLALSWRQAERYPQALAPSARALALREAHPQGPGPTLLWHYVQHAGLLRRLDRLQEAQAVAQRALAVAEASRGPRHRSTGEVLAELVKVLQARGDYAAALPHAQRALAIAEASEGADGPGTEQALGELAAVYGSLGRQRDALPLLERAAAVAEKRYGPDSQATANRLSDLADLHEALGDARRALPLQERALRIALQASGPDAQITATIRYSLGTLLQTLGEYPRALEQLEAALATARRVWGERHSTTAVYLAAVADVHQAMGAPAKALPLAEEAVRIGEAVLGPEHPRTAARLAGLASILEELEQHQRALALYQRVLAIQEAALGPEHPNVAGALQNIADVLETLDQYSEARPLRQRALGLTEKARGPDHPATAQALRSMADHLAAQGAAAQALPLVERALAIHEAAFGREHPQTAGTVSDLAGLHEQLGQYSAALPLRERALASAQTVLGPRHPTTGTRLQDLGLFHAHAGQPARAVPLLEESLAIARAVYGEADSSVAARLNALGFARDLMGQRDEAQRLYAQALRIHEQVFGPQHSSVAQMLNNMGHSLFEQGRFDEALPLLQRALAISRAADGDLTNTVIYAGNLAQVQTARGRLQEAGALFDEIWQWQATTDVGPVTRFAILRKYARWQAALGRRESAIFFGKQAINVMQRLRAQAAALDPAARQGLAARHEGSYQLLAGWLVEAGRLAEAEQVLALLKDQELFELTRRSGAEGGDRPVAMAGGEAALDRRLQEIQLAALRAATELETLNRLQRRGTALDPRQAERRKQLLAEQQEWRQAFQKFMAEVQPALSTDAAAAQASRTATEQGASQLRTLVRAAADGSGLRHAALSFLVTAEGLSVIVTTAEGSFARRAALPASTLNQQVARLRRVLQDRRLDPRPAGQALYRTLFGPVQAELDALAPQVLVLNLTGVLRYVPFPALHDGRQYLTERYAFALHTSAGGTARPRAETAAAWSVTGLGLSQPTTIEQQRFDPLPSVPGELAGIVRTAASPQGALPGRLALDGEFTRDALEETLARASRGETPVVHVASHFHLAPGSDHGSYLVLGDATPLRLSELKEMDFQGVQMLTLSACNTASIGGRNENGSEVEGLAAAVQVAGARTVLATLWPVADASTAAFMQRFYRLRMQPGATHAQALRQAQLELVSGRLQVAGADDAARGLRNAAAADATEPAFTAPAEAPFAHPFFWAPFVLMGSWL